MKTPLLIFLATWPVLATAGSRTSASYSIQTDIVDHGGRRATSAGYTHFGSVNLSGGVSSIAAPAENVKHGYLAQIFEVTGLTLNAATPSVNESAPLQLAAWRVLDDTTFLPVNANAVTWSIASGPLASVSAGGLVTAGVVSQNTLGSVSGTLGSFTASLNLTVLDTIPDNFGAYAGDGLGDDWQMQYFGQNNPLAAPALDPDGDGQTNQFEFTAGLIPTNPASAFRSRVEPVPGQPTQKRIVFGPRLPDRTYTVHRRAALTAPWQILGESIQIDDNALRSVTDLSAGGSGYFYRVEITKP